MKITRNRWVSFYYVVLAAIPISILATLVHIDGASAFWRTPYTIWLLHPAILTALSLAALALAALSFPNRPRSSAFYLSLLCASLLLMAFWALLLPGLVVLLYAIPAWFLLRLYRESTARQSAA